MTALDASGALSGTGLPVVAPGDPRWDGLCDGLGLRGTPPTAIAVPASREDVVGVVNLARERRLHLIAGRGGTTGPLEDPGRTLVLRPAMARVDVDPATRRARVEAGAPWSAVAGGASSHGLVPVAAYDAAETVVDSVAAGGVGWLSRSRGLACNNVTALEVVTAEARRVRADAVREPELFWALRGGGAPVAVVTAVELALHPVAEVLAGALYWPWERAPEVLHAWRSWTATAPDGLSSMARLVQAPPRGPAAGPGRAFLVVQAVTASSADGAALLAPLRALRPELDTVGVMPATSTGSLCSGLGSRTGSERLVSDLTPASVDALVALVGDGREAPLPPVDLRHLGGALAVGAPEHGAMDVVDGRYACVARGRAAGPASEAAPGVLDLFPAPTPPEVAVHHRLTEVSRRYDPAGLLRGRP